MTDTTPVTCQICMDAIDTAANCGGCCMTLCLDCHRSHICTRGHPVKSIQEEGDAIQPGPESRPAWCPHCGPLGIGDIDTEGCCKTCGLGAEGLDAVKLVAQVADLEAENARLRTKLAEARRSI